MIMNRRKFLWGLGGVIAAPAVVKITSIMPVKAMPELPPVEELETFDLSHAYGRMQTFLEYDGSKWVVNPAGPMKWFDKKGELIREVPIKSPDVIGRLT